MSTNLTSFFHPKSVAVVGVSENPQKLGSIIFQNILESGFKGELYGVNPKHGGQCYYGKPCAASLDKAPIAFDLVVIVVPAKFTEAIIDDAIVNKTKNIIIISAGYSEVGNDELEHKIIEKCNANNINVLGPNCLGAILPYANLNASFSDGFPAQGNIAFVSQSGAFCTAMLDWAAQKNIGFSHFISLGNKSGIDEVELIEAFAADPQVSIIALYLESISNGSKLLEIIKRVAPTKKIVILEPGKSKAAQAASASHTGSLSPNARVLQYAYKTHGALQVFSMREMFSTIETLSFCQGKQFGKRTAIVTNAGGAGVLSSDLVEDHNLVLTELTQETQEALSANLPAEANVHNPVDIIGDARSDRYKNALEIVLQDPNVDQVLVLLTPQRTTEVQATAELIAAESKRTTKPILASFIGGKRVIKGITLLEQNGVPAFTFPADAIRIMGLLSNAADVIENTVPLERKSLRSTEVVQKIMKAKSAGQTMLAESDIQDLAKTYGLDIPLSGTFTDSEKGLGFANMVFPKPVVLKISSPSAVHKTDMRGVFLNINDELNFEDAWDNLVESIKIANIPDASVQVQEQVPNTGREVIVGINTDPNFGKVLLFGSGGIYTEIFADTSLRILPTGSIKAMVQETKAGQIIQGVRGQDPLTMDKLLTTIENVQQMALDYPEIISIDMNPIIVTEDRAICVDLKVLV